MLALAREAGEKGGTYPCAFNAANEVAVAAFLVWRRAPFLVVVLGAAATAAPPSITRATRTGTTASSGIATKTKTTSPAAAPARLPSNRDPARWSRWRHPRPDD